MLVLITVPSSRTEFSYGLKQVTTFQNRPQFSLGTLKEKQVILRNFYRLAIIMNLTSVFDLA